MNKEAELIIAYLNGAISLMEGTPMANWDDFPVGVGLQKQLEHVRFVVADRHSIPEYFSFKDITEKQEEKDLAKEYLLDEVWEATRNDNDTFKGWTFNELERIVSNLTDDEALEYYMKMGNNWSRAGRHAVLEEIIKHAKT